MEFVVPTATRACAACSRGKAKCVPSNQIDGRCHRCQRLDKICEPSVPTTRKRKYSGEKKRVTKAQVEKLEQKVDGLVSLLNAPQVVAPNPGLQSIPRENLSPEIPAKQSSGFLAPSPNARTEPRSERPSYSLPIHDSQDDYASKSSPSELTSSEADILLKTFRAEIYPKFPFVKVSSTLSVEDLQHQRPFLFISIMAVTSRDQAQQTEFGKLIMKQLAERMFVKGERSLDLLLGVLIYAGLCTSHFWNMPQLTSLLTAMITLAGDLGLTRQPGKGIGRSAFEDAIRETSWGTAGYMSLWNKSRTREELRAFLGCYFLSSACHIFFRRIDSWMRFTPYVEECRQTLENDSDDANDKLAATMVKLQMLTERIHQSPWHIKSETPAPNIPTMFMVSAFQDGLLQFRKALSSEHENNSIIMMHYHIAEILLYEVGLSKSPPLSHSNGPEFQRLEMLSSSLQAAKAFFIAFLAVPGLDYYSLSVPAWSHFSYSLIMVHILSNFEHPDWNLKYVRETLDFGTVTDRCIERLESVEQLKGSRGNQLFTRSAKRLKQIKLVIESKKTQQGETVVKNTEMEMPSNEYFPDFLLFDEAWLREFMEPLDYQSTGIEYQSTAIDGPEDLNGDPVLGILLRSP